MRKTIRASLLLLLSMTACGGAAAQSPSNKPRTSAMEADVTKSSRRCSETGRASLRRYGRARIGRLAQAVLSQARLQILGVGSVRTRASTLPTPTVPRRWRGSRLAGACGEGPIQSHWGGRSTSLPMKSYEETPLVQGFPTSSTRSRRPDTRLGRSAPPRAYRAKSFAPFALKEGMSNTKLNLQHVQNPIGWPRTPIPVHRRPVRDGYGRR